MYSPYSIPHKISWLKPLEHNKYCKIFGSERFTQLKSKYYLIINLPILLLGLENENS